MTIEVNNITNIKGDIIEKKLILNFKTMPYTSSLNGMTKIFILPQSGKEDNMKKGETWIFSQM